MPFPSFLSYLCLLYCKNHLKILQIFYYDFDLLINFGAALLLLIFCSFSSPPYWPVRRSYSRSRSRSRSPRNRSRSKSRERGIKREAKSRSHTPEHKEGAISVKDEPLDKVRIYYMNSMKLVILLILFHEKANFLILAGSAFYQI